MNENNDQQQPQYSPEPQPAQWQSPQQPQPSVPQPIQQQPVAPQQASPYSYYNQQPMAGLDVEQPSAGYVPSVLPIDLIPHDATPVVPTKKRKSKLLVALVIVLVVAALGTGSAYAYTVYQKPQNVLLEAASKALGAARVRTKTTVTSDLHYDADGTKLAFEKLTYEYGAERTPQLDGNAELVVKYNDTPISIKVGALATEAGAVYFRISNVQSTLEKSLPKGLTLTPKAKEYLAKIDDKWVKYSIDDLKKDDAESAKQVQCMLDTYKKHKDDKKVSQEIVAVYKANQFVVVKDNPVLKDGNYGYEMTVDDKKASAFGKALQKTSIAKEFDACGGEKGNDAEATLNDTPVIDSELKTGSDASKTVTTIWVSIWGHEIRAVDTKTTDMALLGAQKFSMNTHTDVDFKSGVTTKAPTDTMTVDEWWRNVAGAGDELMGGQISARANDTAAETLAMTVAKKAEVYNVLDGVYPKAITDFAKYPESSFVDASQVTAVLPSDTNHVAYKKCTGSIGGQVVYRTSAGGYMARTIDGENADFVAVTALCK